MGQREERREEKLEEQREKKDQEKGGRLPSAVKETLSFLMYIAIVFVLTYLVINLIVDKITYRFRDPERFDIIVFPFQYKDNTYYIKRIIGLPGETVQIDAKGTIYINGEELAESYGREVIAPTNLGLAEQPVTLGEDEYFVLGDNRNHSSDSRDPSVANIKREDIIGRAWLRIYPFSKFGFIKHQ